MHKSMTQIAVGLVLLISVMEQAIAQPAGKWTVTIYDVINLKPAALSTNATGNFTFDAPESRAALIHFKLAGRTNKRGAARSGAVERKE